MEDSEKSIAEVEAGQSPAVGVLKMHKSNHKKKKLIDPAAPKAPVNCFILYLNEHREAVKSEMEVAGGGPGSVKASVLLSELGRRWRLLSGEDRLKYENMFQQKTKEFEIIKSNYKPSDEFLMMVKLREEEENLARQKGATKSSAKTPPGMMKAYFDFVANSWMRVALANQGMSPGEMQKVIWREWMGEGGVETMEKVKKRKRSGEKRNNNSFGVNISDSAKIDEKEKDIDVSSDPNPSFADDDASSHYTPMKVAKVCQSPSSAKVCQSPPSTKVCQSPPSTKVCQSPPSTKICQSPPSTKVCQSPFTPWGGQSPPSAKVCQSYPSHKVGQAPPPSHKVGQSPPCHKVGQSPLSSEVCQLFPSHKVGQAPHSPKGCQSPPTTKVCQSPSIAKSCKSPPITQGCQSPPSSKVIQSPPRTEPVTITRQEHHQPPKKQEQEKAAYAFFQTQMTEELKRVCPQMGEDDMFRSVKEKWAEIPEVQKDIFYREIMQNQNRDTC